MFLTKISRTTSKLILTLTLYWIDIIFQLLLVSWRIQCLQIMYITMVKLLFIFRQIWCYSLRFFHIFGIFLKIKEERKRRCFLTVPDKGETLDSFSPMEIIAFFSCCNLKLWSASIFCCLPVTRASHWFLTWS